VPLEYDIRLAGAVTCEGRPADPDNAIVLQSVSGLDGRDRRAQIEAVPAGDGDFFGPVTRAGITLTVEALITGTSRAALRARERALLAALEPTDTDSTILVEVIGREGDPAGGLRAFMRTSAPLRAPDLADHNPNMKPATWALAAESAVWLGPDDHSEEMAPAAQGGLGFPLVFPISFAGAAGAGTTVTNAGDARVWPELRITGYSANPLIENLTTGERLSFPAYEVPAGGELVITTQPGRRAVTSGSASLYGQLDRSTSSWLSLVPGPNLIRFSDTAHDAAARLEVVYADGYQ